MSRRKAADGALLPAVGAPAAAMPARKQPIILKEQSRPSKRVAEVAGGTTAECVAVFCCCPCGLVNLIVLAVVKLPAGLYRRASRKRKKRRAIAKKEAGLITAAESNASGIDIPAASTAAAVEAGVQLPAKSPATVISEMDREMWTQLFGTGFWRSPSQRE